MAHRQHKRIPTSTPVELYQPIDARTIESRVRLRKRKRGIGRSVKFAQVSCPIRARAFLHTNRQSNAGDEYLFRILYLADESIRITHQCFVSTTIKRRLTEHPQEEKRPCTQQGQETRWEQVQEGRGIESAWQEGGDDLRNTVIRAATRARKQTNLEKLVRLRSMKR